MAIVFIHSGYSPYLEFTLRQARAADPETELVLLGDDANDRFPFLRHVNTTSATYRDGAEAFQSVYEHLATNNHTTVVRWFQRWFWLQTYFRETGLHDAFVLDSDVLLFSTERELRDAWVGVDTALGVCQPDEQSGYRWISSPHVSYWTAPAVEEFCRFILDTYTDPAGVERYRSKWRHHVERGLEGGVCDMTTLYLFAEGYGPGEVANFVDVRQGATCDAAISTSENKVPSEYRMRGGVKAVDWTARGEPTGYNERLGKTVRFAALHLQGHSKADIPAYYRGPAFEEAHAVDRHLRWYYRVRRVASAVFQPARLAVAKLRAH